MVFCRGCGKEIHETAPTCPHCGAPQGIARSADGDIPAGVKGWSWGAFLLNWIWAIGNRTWIGLLAIVPYVGFIMAIVLGFKGREWAWKAKEWESLDHFNRVQKKWSFWGVMLMCIGIVGILAAVAIPAYVGYKHKAEAAQLEQQMAIERAKEEQAQEAAQREAQRAAQEAQTVAALPWSEDTKKEFFGGCVGTATQNVGAEAASTYCACMTNKLSDRVPISMISQSADAVNSAKAECSVASN